MKQNDEATVARSFDSFTVKFDDVAMNIESSVQATAGVTLTRKV